MKVSMDWGIFFVGRFGALKSRSAVIAFLVLFSLSLVDIATVGIALATEIEHQVPRDTSIIITSNLIPTHPEIKMINDTVASLELIEGLPPNAPIFITVDYPKDEQDSTPANRYRLQEYVERLYGEIKQSSDHPVTILNSYFHKHISNSIRLAVNMVETEFIYVIQHDLRFIKPVNHTALVKSMRDHPDQLRMVRFNKRGGYGPHPPCARSLQANGIEFYMARWSDNNHFTTKQHYQDILERIGPTARPVEFPMMYSQGRDENCTDTLLYQWLYNLDGPYIEHLDGRLSDTYRK